MGNKVKQLGLLAVGILAGVLLSLNFSAVGRGDGWMDGYGDPEDGVFFDGSYSLNGTDYPTLPNERMRFELAAPPGP